MWERVRRLDMKRMEDIQLSTWLKVVGGSAIILMVLSFIEFIISRFNASTMGLMHKSMRGIFLSMFLRDTLNVAIMSMVLFLLIGAGVGMVLYFRRLLQEK